MKTKIKIHDGIVGAVIFASTVLAYKVNIQWLWVGGVIGASQSSDAWLPVQDPRIPRRVSPTGH